MAISRGGSHGNWMENFPWTRLANAPSPAGSKPSVDMAQMKASPPAAVRTMLGDGSFGDAWRKPDEDMLRLWETGVAETRAALEGPWA
jgi:creatinine amidohydrolase